MSAFHRIDDWRAVEPGRFFTLVESLVLFPGALRARAMREHEEGGGTPSSRDDRRVSASVALADLERDGLVAWSR